MFEFVGDPQLLEVHVFTGTDFTGAPAESDGMSYEKNIIVNGQMFQSLHL